MSFLALEIGTLGDPSWRDGVKRNQGSDVGHYHVARCIVLVIELMDKHLGYVKM